jgi:Zn-dependent peptidase ImmA (M78 family)
MKPQSVTLIDAQRTRTNSKTTSARVWNRLLDIARRRNVQVFLTNLVGCGDGALFQYKEKTAIVIESNVSKRRRNVFLSHELGHLQLHIDNQELMKPLLSTENPDPAAERQAEYFGRKLRRYLERSLEFGGPDSRPAALKVVSR